MHARACPSISMGMPPMHVRAKRMQSATDGLVTSLAPHDARNSAPEAPLSPLRFLRYYSLLPPTHTFRRPAVAERWTVVRCASGVRSSLFAVACWVRGTRPCSLGRDPSDPLALLMFNL